MEDNQDNMKERQEEAMRVEKWPWNLLRNQEVQQLIKELAPYFVVLVLSCLVLCLIFPEPRAMVLKIWNKVMERLVSVCGVDMERQITLKEFTEQMSKQCDVKIEALKEVSMESCQNVMDKIRATEVNWSTYVEDHVDIDNKNSFNDIVENTGQILELSANAKKSILLAGSSKSAKKVVFDFHGLFKEGGTVNIHVGGYAVTRRKTEDNKGELFNLYIAFSRLEMKNIHLLPKSAQNAIENFGAEEGVTDATIKNEERQHLEGDPGVWKAFFQNCGYKELRDHLHVED